MAEKLDENTATTKDANKKSKARKDAEKLLKFLISRSEDRGIMADLRCALVEGKRYRAWPHLGYYNGIGDKHTERTVQIVSGLFASHPDNVKDGNFGAMCSKLRIKRLTEEERIKLRKEDIVDPISRRFLHLLAAEGEEIFYRVVRFTLRAKAEEIPINYAELYTSLVHWQYPDSADRVRADWARSFWTPRIEEEEPEE